MTVPAQAPSWLRTALEGVERKFREIWPAPLRLKSYATAELPDAADFMGGLVFDSTTSTPKISDGTAWSRLIVGTSSLGTAAYKNTGTSGDAVPLLNAANTWSGAQSYSTAISALNGASSGAATAATSAMLFGFSGAASYRHAVVSRHNAGAATGNALDVYLHSGGAIGDLPTLKVLAIQTDGILPVSGTTASAANVHQASSGSVLLRSTSSQRYKTNVETLTDARADALLQLRPVTYNSTASADEASWKYIGFIAEEVAAIEPRLVHWVPIPKDYTLTVDPAWPTLSDGTQLVPDAVQYDRLPVFMLSVLKRARALVINERQKNAEQDKRIKALEDRLLAAGIV